eukprot:SAG11_NODE_21050_length_433_cov_0.670659_1_plen_67_part_10
MLLQTYMHHGGAAVVTRDCSERVQLNLAQRAIAARERLSRADSKGRPTSAIRPIPAAHQPIARENMI